MPTRWWRRAGTIRGRTAGYPTSSNGASSFHLRWGGLPSEVDLVAAAATLEIVEGPSVADLFFWALQVSFRDTRRETGGAHLGLQWHPAHPGATAVNFGGYRNGGGELDGSDSPLSSATANPNTRDFAWRPNHPYRLEVAASATAGWWDGSVDGVVVRRLDGGGTRLVDPMVWSEVFARCEAPSVTVRWSDFVAVAADGTHHRPDRMMGSYQSQPDGGCANTDVAVDGDGILQITNHLRHVPHGTTFALP